MAGYVGAASASIGFVVGVVAASYVEIKLSKFAQASKNKHEYKVRWWTTQAIRTVELGAAISAIYLCGHDEVSTIVEVGVVYCGIAEASVAAAGIGYAM